MTDHQVELQADNKQVEIADNEKTIRVECPSTRIEVSILGAQGPAGQGVPSGGTTGQALTKNSNTDYDTEWTTISPGGVTSVTSPNGTLAISPTTGAVLADIDLSVANTWTGTQTFNATNPLFIASSTNFTTTDFDVAKIASDFGGPDTNLSLHWSPTYAGGQGALRFWDTGGNLRYLNANLYGENALLTNQLIVGTISASDISTSSLTASGISSKEVLYSNAGSIVGDAGFEWLNTTNRLLLSNASIAQQSRLHIHDSGAAAVEERFTNSSTGSTSSDGFQVGIAADGTAEIRQRENSALNIYTNNSAVANISSTGNLAVGQGTTSGSAKAHFTSTTEQLRLGYDASNYLSTTVGSAGAVALGFSAAATAGILTLTPHGGGGDGTNRTINFGAAWGNPALFLYNNGAGTRFGWGMRADQMQFFAPTTTGGMFTFNRGGDLQTSGTNEILRLVQYAAGTGAGLGMGSTTYSPTSPYRIDFQGVSATTGTAGVEDILRFSRIQTGGVSYPEAFTIGLGRYSSAGTGPDTRVDFKLKSIAATDYTADATVLTLQSNLKVICYGEMEIDGALNHDGSTVGLYNVTPVSRATTGIGAATFAANTSGIANNTATWDGYTIGQVVKALRDIGILT